MMKSRMRWLVLLGASIVPVVSCNDVTAPVVVQTAESIPAPRMALVTATTPQVTASTIGSCALKSDGTAACWGYNNFGQATVPDGLSGITSIAPGYDHTCATKSDGSVTCWGNNNDGATTIPFGLSGATMVAAGYSHTCALKSDGSVVCWGAGGYGEATVPSGLSGVTAIAAQYFFNCALTSDGAVVCWGINNLGQTAVPAGISGATGVSAGEGHACTVKSDGSVVCWGDNTYGQRTVPSSLSPGATRIAAGAFHTCALKIDGSVVCWGRSSEGQATPPTGLTGVTAIAAGGYHTCAVKSDGSVVCWGYNVFGQTNVPADLNLGGQINAQSISFTSTPSSPALVGGTYDVTATGGDSGNPVTFSSLSPNICTVAGTAVSFIATGDCIIAADQEGNETFAAAAQVLQTFAVVAPPNTAPVLADIAPQEVLEGSELAFTASASDSENDQLTFRLGGTVPSGASITETGVFSWIPDDGNTTETFTVIVSDGTLTDEEEVNITVNNVAPELVSIVGQVDPVAVNTSVSVRARFGDAGTSDTHTATIDWNDGTSPTNGIVIENNGAGSVDDSHSYTSAGVYRVRITLVDDDGAEDFSVYEYIVVYDPSAGFVTGGGWINSPAGALTVDPSATGKASFGFVSKYQRGATTPTGNTEFQFHAGDLTFKSTLYDWLVVAGTRAQYKGVGTVNGIGGYNFLLTVTDGTPDKFRIRITNAGGVVYDNVPGGSTQLDAANPQAIAGGSIVVHSSVK